MKIGLVVYKGCMASGLFAFAELLEASNKRSGKKHFECKWVAPNLSPIALSERYGLSGALITPQISILDDSLDAILLPGFWSESPEENATIHASHTDLIKSLAKLKQDKIIWSFCSGVGLLAKAGKLKGRDATSTWWLAEFLQDNFNEVKWRFHQTCIFQGMNATASGVNGYLPIATQLIKTHCGENILREVTKIMVVPRPDKELQAFQEINLMQQDDALIRKIYLWVEKTPAVDLGISELCQFVDLTSRTLARKVKAKTRLSCAHFMRLIKLHQAGEMLIYSTKPISLISHELGYSDDAAFRRSFKRETSYTPSQYRQLFKR